MAFVITINPDGTVCASDSSSKPKRADKGNSIIALPLTYCMLDLETTGYSPDWDDIIEIAAVKYQDGTETERFHTLVQPSGRLDDDYVSEFITELTGITNDMLKDAPQLNEVIQKFAEFLGDDLIVGYNVCFDVNFLYDAFVSYLNRPLTNDFVDCLRMARRLYPDMQHHRLCDMTEKLGIVNSRAH